MLELFTQTQNSDNRIHCLKQEGDDELIIGGTTTHIFYFSFSYSEYIKPGLENCKVIYKQGLEVLLEKYPTAADIKDTPWGTTISITLTPEETKLFKKTSLSTQVQVRLVNIMDQVMYSNPSNIAIKKPLDIE